VEGMLLEYVHWQKELAKLWGEKFVYLHLKKINFVILKDMF